MGVKPDRKLDRAMLERELGLLRAWVTMADMLADLSVGPDAMRYRLAAVKKRAEADRLEALIPVMWPGARRGEAAE